MVDAASPIQVFPQLLAGWGDWIGELPGWIEAAVARDPRLGYLALGLAMFLENLIPPIPSELIQPLGGVLVQQGRLELVPVILVGTAGTVLGCWFWYGLGRWFGEERLIAESASTRRISPPAAPGSPAMGWALCSGDAWFPASAP
jgi:hypothetical protein